MFQDTGHVLFCFPPTKFPFNFNPVMKNWICGSVLLMEKQWHIIYTAVHAVSGRGSAVFYLPASHSFGWKNQSCPNFIGPDHTNSSTLQWVVPKSFRSLAMTLWSKFVVLRNYYVHNADKKTLLTYSILSQQISRIFAKEVRIFMPISKQGNRHKQVEYVYWDFISL